jgi:hypothetical protein
MALFSAWAATHFPERKTKNFPVANQWKGFRGHRQALAGGGETFAASCVNRARL